MSVTARFFIDNLLQEIDVKTDLKQGLDQLIYIFNIPSDKLTNLTFNTLILLDILYDLPDFVDVQMPIRFLEFIKSESAKNYADDLSFNGYVEYRIKSKGQSIFAKAKHPLYLAVDGNRSRFNQCELFLIKVVVLSHLLGCSVSNTEQITLFQKLELNKFCSLYESEIGSASTFINNLEIAFNLNEELFEDKIIFKFLKRLKVAIQNRKENSKPGPSRAPVPKRKTHKNFKRRTPSEKVVRGILKGRKGSIIYQPNDSPIPGESDLDEAETLDIYPERRINGQPVSRSWSRRAAKEKHFRRAITAQFLRTDRNRLTDYQLERLCAASIKQLDSKQTSKGLEAFTVLMTLTTGSEPLFWHDWTFSKLPENCPCIDIDKGVYYHEIIMEEKRWIPNIEQSGKLIKTEDIVALPLEKRLVDYLKSFAIADNKSIAEILGRSGNELDCTATAWIKEMFSQSSMWFTVSRVRDYLFQNVMTRTLDEAMASHICAQPAYKMSPANNYTAFKQSVLVNEYIASLPSTLRFQQDALLNSDRWIGSRLLIKKNVLKDYIFGLKATYEQKRSEIDRKSTPRQIFDCHNAFMDYLIFCSFVETSHRPVDDPFARRVDFLDAFNAVFITDKVVSEQNKTRLSFHGKCLRGLIEVYDNHLQNLSFWFAHFEFNLEANIVQSLLKPKLVVAAPFFFYLKESRLGVEFESVSISKLNQRMPDFSLPWNFGRHLRSTHFRELGVPAEYIATDMGHIGPGEQPFDRYSINKPEYIEKVMSPAVDVLSKSIGISSDMLPIPFKQKFIRIPDVHISVDYIRKLGFEKRQSKRQKKARGDREIISSVFNDFFNHVDPKEIDENTLIRALEKVYELKPINLIKTLNKFNYAVARFISKHELKLSPPNRLIELKKEPSVFDPNSPLLIDMGMYLRKHFFEKELLTPLAKSNRKCVRGLLTKLYFCLHLFSFISCKDMLERILAAASSEDYFWKDSILFVNFRHQGEVYRRITLDDISASLFSRVVQVENISQYKTLFELEVIERHIEKEIWSGLLAEYPAYQLKYLRLITQELSKIFMPGFIVPVLSGARKVASLKEPSYIRYQSGCQLEENHSLGLETIDEKQAYKYEDPIDFGSGEPVDLKKEKSLRSLLVRTLRNPTYNKTREKLSEQLREQIALMQKESQPLQITILLAKWLVDTINRPGFRVSQLRLSTIQKEFYYIASYVTERLCKVDVFSASDEQLLEAYQDIVNVSDHNQQERKTALLNFQKYLTTHFKVESVASSDLEAFDPDNPFRIDANYLSENEYSLIFQRLLDFSDENAEELALIFCFYFRLGFRVSEAFKLSFKDIHFDRLDNSYIVHKFNHMNPLKNKASVRTSHFFGKLNESEFNVLQKWYMKRLSLNPALTSCIWSVDSDDAKRVLRDVIYQVTGDYSFNLRALRHGVASHEVRFFNEVALIADESQSSIGNDQKEFLLHHFYSSLPSRRHIYLTARNLGHGGPSTTLFHYTNNYEELVQQHYHHSLPTLQRYGLYAALFSKSLPLLRQWVRRYQATAGSSYKAILKKLINSQKQYADLKLKYCWQDTEQVEQYIDDSTNPFNVLINMIELIRQSATDGLDSNKSIEQYDVAVVSQKLSELCIKIAINPWGLENLNQLTPLPIMQAKQDIRALEQLKRFDWKLFDSIDEAALVEAAKVWENARGIFCFESVEDDQMIVDVASKLNFSAKYLMDKSDAIIDGMEFLPEISVEKFRGGLKKPFSLTVHPSIMPLRPTLRFVDSQNKVVDRLLGLIFVLAILRSECENLDENLA